MLTVVLFFFLIYPLICRVTFSMSIARLLAETRSIGGDLEKPCFSGRHQYYVLSITIPQMLLYVLGLRSRHTSFA